MKNRNLDHSDDWKTPDYFYKELDKKYNFDFDPCPYKHDINKWDGLEIEWGERNYVNPGYSLKSKESFVKKGIEESKKGKLCVFLLPVSTSTKLFHDVILPNRQDLYFVKGRIKFIGQNEKGQIVNDPEPDNSTILYEGKKIPRHIKACGQHDSMVVIFDGRKRKK